MLDLIFIQIFYALCILVKGTIYYNGKTFTYFGRRHYF